VPKKKEYHTNLFFKEWQELCLSIKEVRRMFLCTVLRKQLLNSRALEENNLQKLLAYSLKSPFSLCYVFFDF